MTRDASLDEFLGGGDEDGDAAGTDADGAESETAAGAAPEDDRGDGGGAGDGVADEEDPPLALDGVEPARSTYAWSPDGAECAACGATVEARWRGEAAEGLVCADCKEW